MDEGTAATIPLPLLMYTSFTAYRPAPPPPVYPNMAMPAAHYGGFQPMKVHIPNIAAYEHTRATRGGRTAENYPPRPQPDVASDLWSTYR